MHPLTDDFLALWENGGPPNEDALREFTTRLFKMEQAHVFACIRRRVDNYHDAEDICVETFELAYRAWSQMPSPPENPSLFRYLARIYINRCWNWLRTKGRHPVESLTPDESGPEEDRMSTLATGSDSDPEAILEAQEALAIARRCLSMLNPTQRKVIELSYGAQLTDDDIARELGATPANIRQIRHRALARMRDMMQARRVPDAL